jgi:hypothetical protein
VRVAVANRSRMTLAVMKAKSCDDQVGRGADEDKLLCLGTASRVNMYEPSLACRGVSSVVFGGERTRPATLESLPIYLDSPAK